MTDWRRLLVKYMAIASWAEGIDFLYEGEWTPEDWVAMQEISLEVDAVHDIVRGPGGKSWIDVLKVDDQL